jgi:hypothetical protein
MARAVFWGSGAQPQRVLSAEGANRFWKFWRLSTLDSQSPWCCFRLLPRRFRVARLLAEPRQHEPGVGFREYAWL